MNPEKKLQLKNAFDGNLVMGGSNFNKQTGRDVHLKKLELQKKQFEYADPATGILKKELSRERGCPVCNANDSDLLFIKDGFPHRRCNQCSMVYVTPVLKDDHLHSFYMDEDSYTQVLMNKIQLELDQKKFHYGLDLIEEYQHSKGNLLDIGSGPGIFLETAKARGWDVTGLEFNKWCLDRIKSLNIPVFDTPLEETNFQPNSFQCITLWTVLEHIIEPAKMLRHIYRLLAPGGIFLILVPNIDSLSVRILHEKSATFSGYSHVNFFNANTLQRILKQENFIVNEHETLITDINTIMNYLDFEDPYFGNAKPVLDFLTPQYIHDHMLGYVLLTIATADKSNSSGE